jgi:L-ectoine synthase
MFARTINDLKARGEEVVELDGRLRSFNLLSKADGLGFSVHDVRSAAGSEEVLWYKNHWESNYVIAGEGSVEEISSGRIWPLGPGTIYAVGPQDRHRFRADSEVHLISIFNPPLDGREAYDEDGSYEATGEPPGRRGTMFVKRVDELRAAGRELLVAGGSARSVRVLLQEDGVGLTLCDVNFAAGNEATLWYKNHWEANLILDGRGQVSDLTSNERWVLLPGTIYTVGPEDRHRVAAESDIHLLSVFNPPLEGSEQHDADGTLAASGPLPPGPNEPPVHRQR